MINLLVDVLNMSMLLIIKGLLVDVDGNMVIINVDMVGVINY